MCYLLVVAESALVRKPLQMNDQKLGHCENFDLFDSNLVLFALGTVPHFVALEFLFSCEKLETVF